MIETNLSKQVFATKLIEHYDLISTPYFRGDEGKLRKSLIDSNFKCYITGLPFKTKEKGILYRPECIRFFGLKWVIYPLQTVLSSITSPMSGKRKPFVRTEDGDDIFYTPQDQVKDKLIWLLERGLSKEEFITAYRNTTTTLDKVGFYNK